MCSGLLAPTGGAGEFLVVPLAAALEAGVVAGAAPPPSLRCGSMRGQARTVNSIMGKSAPSAINCASCGSRQGIFVACFALRIIAIPEDRMSSSASGRVTM